MVVYGEDGFIDWSLFWWSVVAVARDCGSLPAFPAGSNLLWSLLSLQRPTLYPSCPNAVLPTNLPGHGHHSECTQAQDSCSAAFAALEHLLASWRPPSDCFSVHPGHTLYEPRWRSICCHSKRRCDGGRCRGHFSGQDTLLLPRGPSPDEERAAVDGCLGFERETPWCPTNRYRPARLLHS